MDWGDAAGGVFRLRGDAAGDLHIKQTLGHAIAPRHFAQHHPKRGARHWHGERAGASMAAYCLASRGGGTRAPIPAAAPLALLRRNSEPASISTNCLELEQLHAVRV